MITMEVHRVWSLQKCSLLDTLELSESPGVTHQGRQAHSRKMLECCPEASPFWRFSAFFCTCLDWNWDIPRKCGESSDFLGDHVVITDPPKKTSSWDIVEPNHDPTCALQADQRRRSMGPTGMMEANWGSLKYSSNVSECVVRSYPGDSEQVQ